MSPRRRGRGRGGHGPAVAAAAAPSGADLPVTQPAEASAVHAAAPSPAMLGARSRGRRSADGPGRGPKPQPVAAEAPTAPTSAETPADGEEVAVGKASCTLAQMRRFIKSRPYVPVHELRRRFEIQGMEDEVNPMSTAQGTLYVGLPAQQAGYLSELIKAGDVGCELLMDPTSPAVVGVYPMRPIARQ